MSRISPAARILDGDMAVDAAVSSWSGARDAPSDIDALSCSPGIHVLGRNRCAESLLARSHLAGIVDDFATGTVWTQGVPVVRSADLQPGTIVINCSTSISPISAGRRLLAQPGVRVIPYSALIDRPDAQAHPEFVLAARADLELNRHRYRALEARLADRESRRVFRRLLDYRLTADYGFMDGFSVRTEEQYFESFLGSHDGAVFVDCGGYDGDTTELFATRHPRYARIHCFEPSPANMKLARCRLQGMRDVELIELGVSDFPGWLSFDPSAGSACAIGESGHGGHGAGTINVTTLDTYIAHPVSFIKMDLEGWEMKALAGSERHIREDKPALAIAVYHDIRDFWRIPEFVLGVAGDYDVALRHYTEGWSETIMYFVPRGRLTD